MPRGMNAFAGGSSSEDSESEQDDFLHPSTDPHADEFADYNPRKRRRTAQDTKERAALGIFGSESEDDGPGRRWKKKNIRSKGMAFVKPGQKPGQDEEDDEDDEEEDEEDEHDIETEHGTINNGPNGDNDVDMDEEEEDRPRMGLGLGAQSFKPRASTQSGTGSNWRNPSTQRVMFNSGESSSPLGKGFVPSSATIPVLLDRDEEPTTPRVALPSAFSTPTAVKAGRGKGARDSSSSTPINAGSFAARMMAKMGYKEGQGLGKEGQGRSGVIEVQLRPQGVGLGAVREKSQQEKVEEKRQAKIRGEVLEDSEEEEKKRRRKGKSSGTGSGMSTPKKRPKAKYQSLPEMQRAAPGLKIPEAFTPILDMTGREHRLLTSTSGLLTPTATTSTAESVLDTEAKKIARRAQSDLGAFVEEWKNLEERKAWVEMEILQQRQAIDEQGDLFDHMKSVADIVQGLSDSVSHSQWDPTLKALTEVESIGLSSNDELADIAVAAVHPFFRQAVEGWQPLEDPKLSGVASEGFAPALYSIRSLLGMGIKPANGSALATQIPFNGDTARHGRHHKTNAFESMMYTVWLPKVRSAITNVWDVQDPTPLQALLDTWEGLLPPFIRSQILDQLVVRKLDEAVAAWNPKKRSRSPLPHLWLFPWLQYLPSHHADPKSSTGLVSDVKRKFRHLIDAWDFRRGVVPGLQQWRSVLQTKGGSDQWTPLLMNHVLPNLARFLRTHFQVAPQDQEPFMPFLHSTFEWQDILGSRIMGQLLVDELFPMWQDVLHQWLTLDGVNYVEIGEWFAFWRSIIPESLNAVPAVKAQWQIGSDLINKALDLGSAAKTSLPAPRKLSPHRTAPSTEEHVPLPAKPAPEVEEVTFRHQLEEWCMAHELQFIPEKSTLEANGPVYRITAAPIGKGGVLVYLKGESVHAMIKRGTWTPLKRDMDALFELAHR